MFKLLADWTVETAPYFLKAVAAVSAAFVLAASGLGVALGESKIAVKSIEAIGRNPDAAGKIRSNMIVGIALVETCAIYGLVVAILLIFALGV